MELTEKEIEQEISDKGINAPRINSSIIDSKIMVASYTIFEPSMTVCCLTLTNGYQVIGESACVSPEHFDKEMGRRIAFNDARNKIWALEGYRLKTELSNEQN